MPSSCKRVMHVNTEPKIPVKNGKSASADTAVAKETVKEAATPVVKASKKTAAKNRKTKATTPEDAILASAAVDPDLENAVKPKKSTGTKSKSSPAKTSRTRKTTTKKTRTKKA